MSHGPTELCVGGVDESRDELVQSAGRDVSVQASSTQESSLGHRPGRSEHAWRASARERRPRRGKSADRRFGRGRFVGRFGAVHVRVVGAKVRAPSLDPAAIPASATDNPLTAPGWRRERKAGPPLAGTRTRAHCQKGVQTRIVSGYRDEIALSGGHRGVCVGIMSRGGMPASSPCFPPKRRRRLDRILPAWP